MNQLQKQCQEAVETAFKLAEECFSTTLIRPTVSFSSRLTSTAGKAYLQQNRIKLSTPILNLNTHKFVQDTPGHEAAHLIAFQLWGSRSRGHGKEWKKVMRVIGQPANRCHSFATPTKQTYSARCGCRTHQLSKIRANRLQLGTSTYYCKFCEQRLNLLAIREPIHSAKPNAKPKTKSNKFSKADLVRKIIQGFKNRNVTLEQAQHDIHNIEFVMRTAGLSKSLAKTYLVNNWN